MNEPRGGPYRLSDVRNVSSVIRSNAKKYRNSEALTETYEFPDRSHFTGVEPGWEQVADYALQWATSHARTRQS